MTNEEQMMKQRADKMSVDEAIRRLKDMIKTRQAMAVGVHRKRSWKDSEKAMTLAEYQMQIDALVKAINLLNAHDVSA